MFIYIDNQGNETRCANWATAREYQLQNGGAAEYYKSANGGQGKIIRAMQFS